MGERTQIVESEPSMATEFLGSLLVLSLIQGFLQSKWNLRFELWDLRSSDPSLKPAAAPNFESHQEVLAQYRPGH
jgi:hypothetical protein